MRQTTQGGGARRHRGGFFKQNNPSARRRASPSKQNCDSNGPGNLRVKGSASQVAERYLQLARDAQSSGDRVLMHSLLQHADHYRRVASGVYDESPVNFTHSGTHGGTQGGVHSGRSDSGNYRARSNGASFGRDGGDSADFDSHGFEATDRRKSSHAVKLDSAMSSNSPSNSSSNPSSNSSSNSLSEDSMAEGLPESMLVSLSDGSAPLQARGGPRERSGTATHRRARRASSNQRP